VRKDRIALEAPHPGRRGTARRTFRSHHAHLTPPTRPCRSGCFLFPIHGQRIRRTAATRLWRAAREVLWPLPAGRFRFAGLLARALAIHAARVALRRALEAGRPSLAAQAARAPGRVSRRIPANAFSAAGADARSAGSRRAPARGAAVRLAPGSERVRLFVNAKNGARAPAGGDMPARTRARGGRYRGHRPRRQRPH
jgi:hypothetical protein